MNILAIDKYFMTIFRGKTGVYKWGSAFWSITLQPDEARKATMPQMKGNIHIFHMRHGSMICTKRLQNYDSSLTLLSVVEQNEKIVYFSLPFSRMAQSSLQFRRPAKWCERTPTAHRRFAARRPVRRIEGEKGPSFLRGAHLPRRALRW